MELLPYHLRHSLCHGIPGIFEEVVGTEGGDTVLIGGVAEEGEHEGGKLVRIIMAEEETGVALFDEVRHLITVAADTRETKGQGLDEDETVSLEVTRHAEDVTHVVVLGFLIEGYLTNEVVTGYGILDGVLLRADDIQFDVLALLTEELEGIIGDIATLALEVLAHEEDFVVCLRLRANQLSVNVVPPLQRVRGLRLHLAL